LIKLQTSSEEEQVRDRHLAWFLGVAEQAGEEIDGSNPKPAIETIEREYPNLRIAFVWSLTAAYRLLSGYRLTHALAQFWQMRGYFSEGSARLDTVLSQHAGVPEPLQAQAFQDAGFLANHVGDFERAKRYLQKALEIWQGLGNRGRIAWVKGFQSWTFELEGDLEAAGRVGEEALALHREDGDQWGIAAALLFLGGLAYRRGDLIKARVDLEKSLAICRRNGYGMGMTRRLTRLGQINLALGDREYARSLFEESLRLSRDLGDQWGLAMGLAGMAALALEGWQPERAASLLGATQALLDSFGTNLWHVDQMEYEQNVASVKAWIGESRFETAWRQGFDLGANDLDQVIELAFADESPQPEPDQPPLTLLRATKREFGGLTRREREVAALIAQGKSNPAIAKALYIGLRTVEAHVTHILNKLGFSSRTQIAGWAIQKGLASSPQALEDPTDG
jgi:non-specific serine/threonine protein kinase